MEGGGRATTSTINPPREIALWKERCPVPRLRTEVLFRGILSETELEELERLMEQEVEAAVRYAEESPWPTPEEALEDVYV